MQQNTQNFMLNFATLFQCSIKPLKSKNQREAVNALLIEPGAENISDAASSNYTTGKRVVPDDYRSTLAALSDEELTERLTYIGILEYDRMCVALRRLVECARIPSSQRKRLIDTYQNSGQIEFIKSTVRAAADCKEIVQLTNSDINHLAEFANVESSAEPMNNKPTPDIEAEATISNPTRYPLFTQKFEDKYNHNWISEYTPQNTDIEDLRSRDFFGSTVVSSQQDLNMPYDFPKLLCFLTPMVKGNPIDEFTVEEFMDCMSISIINNKVTNGSIECLKLAGPAKGVVKFISRLNLSEVSDVAFLMAGKITNRDAKDIENAIRTASNKNVNCIHSMWYDEEIPEIELTLITHLCPGKAKQQSTYEIDEDGVKIPKQDKE
ncbi:MAG: hypothetical protein J6A08_04790 [Lachnospiraceae bacterium]|nr:hypothetical protein [Lachnospiraceae bacterium]